MQRLPSTGAHKRRFCTLENLQPAQYEISNWALDQGPSTEDQVLSSFVLRPPSFACRHNLQYWRSLSYLAFGAGAYGYADGYRYSNVLRIKTYIERLSMFESRTSNIEHPLTPVTVNHHKQSLKDDMSEFMMTGLRLTREGVSFDDFQTRFGISMQDVYGKEIDELLALGLLEESPLLPRGEGCVFHGKAATCSTRKLPLIP